MTTPSQAAQKVRNCFKRMKINPRGKVNVVSSDYHTSVCIDTGYLDEDEARQLNEVLRSIDEGGNFDLRCS